ncbi:MAG TPA: hypothetical protein VEZ88_09765 [Steroidobacteraceae bacterium]|nr:hypothetical protein [Steroidobacteraceae bacterium]
MNKMLTVAFGAILVISAVQARDTHLKLPLTEAMQTADYKAKVDPNIKMYFGAQEHPKPAQSFGTVKTNKKTNFFNKSDKEGCEWVFLSAIMALQDAARQRGGNAVVNIKSNYKNVEFSSETEYECGAGSVTGGVALIGEIVKL